MKVNTNKADVNRREETKVSADSVKDSFTRQPLAWALIVLGVLALLSGGGFLSGLSVTLRTLLFGVGGALLVRRYLQRPSDVWALVLGLGLLVVALLAVSSATTVLGALSLIFIVIYRRDARRWWAVLPAGLFLSLAFAVGLGGTLLGTAPLLFLGFAATFGTLMRLNKRWAVYPAIAALALALLTSNVIGGSLLPLLLIGGGVVLFVRNESPNNTSEPTTSEANNVNLETKVGTEAQGFDLSRDSEAAESLEKAEHA